MYFHCHWFGDIVAGLLIGTGVGLCVFKLGTKAILKDLWLQHVGLPMADEDAFGDL